MQVHRRELGPLALDGVDDGPPQHLGVDTTLDQVVLGTRCDRRDSEVLVVQPGEHDDRDGGTEFAQAVQGVDPVRVGQVQVEQYAVRPGICQIAFGI